MKIILVISIFLSTVEIVLAQDRKIADIRKAYQETKEIVNNLKKAETPEESGALYCLKMEDNVYTASYPGVGTYNKKLRFYYDRLDSFNLVMAVEITTISAVSIYCEWFYIDGNFAFAYEKNGYYGDIERRLYYDDTEQLYYSENNEKASGDDANESIERMRRKGTQLQQTFELIKGIE